MRRLITVLFLMMTVCIVSVSAKDYIEYTFDNTVSDATVSGSVTYEDGVSASAVHFSNSAYLSLPSGIVSQMSDFTVSAWVKPDGIYDWARVFDFGTDTDKYMFLTLRNNLGETVFAITTGGASGEQKISIPSAFKAGVWTHIAVVKSGNTGIIYVDGVEAGKNTSMTLSPSSLGTTDKNYIAKSQYNDPYFDGCIDDLRIYSKGLTSDEIAEVFGESNSNIESVDKTEISIEANSELTLPEYVNARFRDGSEREVKVEWDSFDESLLNKDGEFIVNGKVLGTQITAEAKVTVYSDSITKGLTAVSSIYSDKGKVYGEYVINNESSEKEAILLIAVYGGDVLQGIGVNYISDFKSGEYSVSADLPELEDITVKAYLWNKKLNPLVKNVQRIFKNPYGSSFEVSEVKLLDGIFKTSQDTGKEFIMSLDTDRLLAPVAYSVGAITDKSAYYGGWEAYDYRGYAGRGITGHSLGHWMSAAATMYAATGDEEVKEKLDYVVDKLYEYQLLDGSGYIGGFEKTGFEAALSGDFTVVPFDLNGYWVPWYSLHKIYQGLIDAYELTGNEKALTVVCGFADWAKNITDPMSDEKFNLMLTCEYGGMNEVMAKLYDITGEKKYLDLGIRFTQPAILEPLSNGVDELQGKHANTQIPKVIGAAAIYEEDEERTDYRSAAEFFYETVVNNRSYCIGGNSNYEHFGTVEEEVLGTQTCETCNTYNMMKLTEHLYAWNHDAKYMDYYEKALFNHILASQDPDTGMKTYFMATKQGHFKVYSTPEDSFWCCVGSGMENPGRYTRNIYYKDGNEFYVNQFISSIVEWKEKDITISQTTNYPYEDTTVIKVDKGSAALALKIRIPSWIASPATVQVNGETPITVTETGYYTIERVWTEGDTIKVTLPMGLHTYTARDSQNKVAFMYGPVVLAGALGTDNFPSTDIVSDHTSLDSHASIEVPDIVVADKNPETFITPTDLTKLEFKMTAGDKEIKLIPYFDLHHERYSLYWMLYGENESVEKDGFSEALDAVTIDTVRPNEQQPEVDHAMQKNNSYSGYFDTAACGWRDARGDGGYFSYEMEVKPSGDNYVAVMYWGGDGPFGYEGVSYTREFEILADDTVIGTQTLNNNSPGNLFYEYYKIPAEVAKGKEKVTVKFRAAGTGKAAGGVFEVRTTTAVVEK